MEKMLYYDICALVILAILIISMLFRGIYRGKANRMFIILLVLSFMTTVFDINAVALDNAGPGNLLLKNINHSLYLLLHNFTAPLYIIYVIYLSDTWHIIKKHYVMFRILILPVIFDAILIIINPFTGKLFYFDEAGMYTRGDLFFLLYVIVGIYFVVGLFYLCYCRKLFSMRRFTSLFVIYPLLLAALLVQMINPHVLIEMFAISISLLYISMMIIRPEESIESSTGLQKIDRYVKDLDSAVMTDKHVRIIMINITNYETIRKMLGYENSHKLLREISSMLIAMVRNEDPDVELYYLERGCFRVVLEIPTKEATIIAEKINTALKDGIIINQMSVNLTACVCLVNFPEDIPDSESLIAFGNELDGRYYNGSVLYATDIYQHSKYELMRDMDGIIEHALSNNKFEVYYQPIYSVREKAFTSAEALLRLHTDDGNFISPAIFIPAAEKSGAIHKIGDFVLEEVCKFISGEDFERLGLKYIEVNLSVTQCMQPNLSDNVLSILKKYNVDTSKVNLEITETAASYSQNTMMNNLNNLSAAGIHFSLDDFGTGYSNMVRIASLPLHIVKLDKSFSDVADTENMNAVLENTIRMIKEMKMKIVVEGVETAELAKKFSELDCEYIQGFYYARPIPVGKLIEFLG